MKTLAALFALTTVAFGQGGPPPGFFGSAPNVGGTLFLTWCTSVGWPCHDVKQEVWGQICYGGFAQSYANEQVNHYQHSEGNRYPNEISWPFIKYAGWKCPGAQFDDAAKKIGYSDGGPPLKE